METKSVTVEWFERGETKGKEVNKQVRMVLGMIIYLEDIFGGDQGQRGEDQTDEDQDGVGDDNE